jgi:hypothetical protein
VIVVAGRLDSGLAVPIARRAAALGAAVELVSTVPPGASGDSRLGELAAAGVRHAAALRSPAPALEPADLDLAIRYLPEVRLVVVASDAATLAAVAAEAAAWSNAAFIVLSGEAERLELPDDRAIVLAGPATDSDEAFAGLVADLAVRLDAGEDPTSAWRAVAARQGLEEVSLEATPPSRR